jgi:hypothetical protein
MNRARICAPQAAAGGVEAKRDRRPSRTTSVITATGDMENRSSNWPVAN